MYKFIKKEKIKLNEFLNIFLKVHFLSNSIQLTFSFSLGNNSSGKYFRFAISCRGQVPSSDIENIGSLHFIFALTLPQARNNT